MKSIKSLKCILEQLNYVVDKEQKKRGILVLLCMIITSVLELIGVSAIYPFLQIMLDNEALQNQWYTAFIYGFFPSISIKGVLLLIGGAIIVVYLIKNTFMILSSYVQYSFAAKFQCELSVKVLSSYMKRPYTFFLNTNSSIIYRGITTDVNGVYAVLLNFFTMFSEMLTVMALGIFLFVTDWMIALGTMGLAAICFLAIVFGFRRKIKIAGKNMRKSNALKGQYGYQAINGIKEIMVLDRSENFVNQFKEAAVMAQNAEIINGFVGACPDRILEGVCIGGIMGIVCIRIMMGMELNTFIPVLGTFALGAFRILPSISKISSRINSLIFYQQTVQNTYDILQEMERYEQNLEKKDFALKVDNIHFNKELTIKNAKWKYQNTVNNVLENISISIKKGESVAFIGASGMGKTTLADIIMGLLKPQEGSVEIDGIDIYRIPHQWTKIIGYVPQSVFLIDDTVRKNIAFGLEEEKISDEKVWEALEQAQLKEFVKTLPYGLDTIVGERGVKFSGGQRQRIAIARALYENPEILILDEATSSLDNETENAVMEAIDALQGFKTLIIVAHRLTTIKNCDRVFEIRDGVAIERDKREIM